MIKTDHDIKEAAEGYVNLKGDVYPHTCFAAGARWMERQFSQPVAPLSDVWVEVPVSERLPELSETRVPTIDHNGVHSTDKPHYIITHPDKFKCWLEKTQIPLTVQPGSYETKINEKELALFASQCIHEYTKNGHVTYKKEIEKLFVDFPEYAPPPPTHYQSLPKPPTK